MDRGKCPAVYLDDRVDWERWVVKDVASVPEHNSEQFSVLPLQESDELSKDIAVLLNVFKQGESFPGCLAPSSPRNNGPNLTSFFCLSLYMQLRKVACSQGC